MGCKQGRNRDGEMGNSVGRIWLAVSEGYGRLETCGIHELFPRLGVAIHISPIHSFHHPLYQLHPFILANPKTKIGSYSPACSPKSGILLFASILLFGAESIISYTLSTRFFIPQHLKIIAILFLDIMVSFILLTPAINYLDYRSG